MARTIFQRGGRIVTGKQMRDIRRSAGITAAGIARLLGRSPSAIKAMETDRFAIAADVAQWLGTFRDFMGDHPPPAKSRNFTWTRQQIAAYRDEWVIIPDEVVANPTAFTKRAFPARRSVGRHVRVVINATWLAKGEIRLRSR